jgi:hypothetical protein
MSGDCGVCDFPVEFCCCELGPQCTECGMQCGDLDGGCPAIFPSRVGEAQ